MRPNDDSYEQESHSQNNCSGLQLRDCRHNRLNTGCYIRNWFGKFFSLASIADCITVAQPLLPLISLLHSGTTRTGSASLLSLSSSPRSPHLRGYTLSPLTLMTSTISLIISASRSSTLTTLLTLSLILSLAGYRSAIYSCAISLSAEGGIMLCA